MYWSNKFNEEYHAAVRVWARERTKACRFAASFNQAHKEHGSQMALSGKIRGNHFAAFMWLSDCRTNGYKIDYMMVAKDRLN
jgi:hypothetical protein